MQEKHWYDFYGALNRALRKELDDSDIAWMFANAPRVFQHLVDFVKFRGRTP